MRTKHPAVNPTRACVTRCAASLLSPSKPRLDRETTSQPLALSRASRQCLPVMPVAPVTRAVRWPLEAMVKGA